MSTTVRDNSTVEGTFLLVMRLNINIAMSSDSLIVILYHVFIIKRLTMDIRNFVEIKYELARLVGFFHFHILFHQFKIFVINY